MNKEKEAYDNVLERKEFAHQIDGHFALSIEGFFSLPFRVQRL